MAGESDTIECTRGRLLGAAFGGVYSHIWSNHVRTLPGVRENKKERKEKFWTFSKVLC